MGRPPNPSAKTPSIFIIATKEEEAIVIRAVKQICAVDGLAIKTETLKLFQQWLHEHNWPPGNPQIQITKFVEKQLVELSCEYPGCHNLATWLDYPNPPGKNKVYYCEAHHKHALENQLLKPKTSKRL